MKNVRETLIAARELIADPANWKQGGLSEIENDKCVGPFCALGAIGRATETLGVGYGADRTGSGDWTFGRMYQEKNHTNPEVQATRLRASELLGKFLDKPVHEFNDSSSHDCVLAAFDAAIERATEQEMASC